MKKNSDLPPEVIYEVHAKIDPDAYDEYVQWLGPHAEHVCQSPGFIGFKIWRVESHPHQIVVQYHLRSREDLENYFRTQAPALRKEAQRRFGGRFTAERRILLHLAD